MTSGWIYKITMQMTENLLSTYITMLENAPFGWVNLGWVLHGTDILLTYILISLPINIMLNYMCLVSYRHGAGHRIHKIHAYNINITRILCPWPQHYPHKKAFKNWSWQIKANIRLQPNEYSGDIKVMLLYDNLGFTWNGQCHLFAFSEF